MKARVRNAIRLRSERRIQNYREELLEMKMKPEDELTAEDKARMRIIPQNIIWHEEIVRAHPPSTGIHSSVRKPDGKKKTAKD